MIKTLTRIAVSAFVATSLALAGVGAPTSVRAMTVQPVVVDLRTAGRQMSTVISVQNSFATPLPVELTAVEATFDETGLHATTTPTNDLLIFPPQALIPAGQTQSFRVQYVGDPALATSRHYYVTVAQLPVRLPEGQSAIQILYNFQVVVSVGPAGARPNIQITRTEIENTPDGKHHPVVYLTNDSNTYGYLSDGRLRVVQHDAANHEVFRRAFTPAEIQQTIGFGLVAAGQHRRLPLSIDLPSGEGSVEVEFTPENRR
jgi:fimbrial chaperone protein